MSDSLVIDSDRTLDGATNGAVSVLDGAVLTIAGEHRGAVDIQSLATVIVTGDLLGPVDVRVAGTLIVEPSGRVVGTVTNFGSFVNRGLRAGRVEERDPDDQEGAVVVPPTFSGSERYDLPAR